MNILFVTRKYPPSIGGMQKINYLLSQELRKKIDVKVVSFGKSQSWLPIALNYLFIKSCFILLTEKIDLIFLGDALLSSLGLTLRSIFKKPLVVTTHGLDVTWKFPPYQFLIRKSLPKIDKLICVSSQTARECIRRGVSEERIAVINNGIDPNELILTEERGKLRKRLSDKLGVNLANKRLLLSVGRLVERKGYHWFIKETLPRLSQNKRDLVYLIAGDGPLRNRIEGIIKENNLGSYVLLLGKVDEQTLKLLYNASDIFIMPNIKVEGDMEGFGIVILEASSCGLPIVASGVEGIIDAVREENGFLVEPGNAQGFVDVIAHLLEDETLRKEKGTQAKLLVEEKFTMEKVAKKYLDEFERCLLEQRGLGNQIGRL